MGGKNMAHPILVTGAAGRVGGIGRTVTTLLLQQGKAARRAWASRLLCAASSLSPWRLRDLEIPRANSAGSLGAQDLRTRDLGRGGPPRIRPATGRHRGPGALVFQWL